MSTLPNFAILGAARDGHIPEVRHKAIEFVSLWVWSLAPSRLTWCDSGSAVFGLVEKEFSSAKLLHRHACRHGPPTWDGWELLILFLLFSGFSRMRIAAVFLVVNCLLASCLAIYQPVYPMQGSYTWEIVISDNSGPISYTGGALSPPPWLLDRAWPSCLELCLLIMKSPRIFPLLAPAAPLRVFLYYCFSFIVCAERGGGKCFAFLSFFLSQLWVGLSAFLAFLAPSAP